MKMACEDYDQLSVLKLQGDLTAADTPALRQTAQQRLAGTTRDLVIDASQLEYADSQGLETLLWLQECCGQKLGQLRLAAASANLLKILEITRLSGRIERHPDVPSAVKSLKL